MTAPCWLCLRRPEEQERCRRLTTHYKLHKHHWLDQQTIKREYPNGHDGVSLTALLADDRNLVHMRQWHHMQLENRRLHIPRWMVPPEAVQFAEELGLDWRLDRLYPYRVAA